MLRVESEDEVAALLSAAYPQQVPVTFRAAGTSLSGQAISDSVLLVLGDNWNGRDIRAGGTQIRLQPGVIGAQANAWLAPFGRKIGPDPASINACKIGGIVANNASGMCCGTAQNSYHTLAGLRLLLADGTRLDSEDPASIAAFRASHGALLERLAELGRETRANAALAAKIRHKYRLKNTTGLSLNALVDYDEPLDILTHLMVGSEGTLGFISAVTYDTVPEHPHKARALLVFPTVETCCKAVAVLKRQPVSAVELLDRRSLRSVENMQGMPEWVKSLSAGACALLIESRAATQSLLHEQLGQIMASIAEYPLEKQVDFSEDPAVYNQLWRIRKDTFPAVGAVRETGTTVIIEDVTFPVEQLAEGVNRLIELFDKHRYDEAILFGHALEGNLHFVFTQGFDSPEQIARYSAFMDDVAHLVAVEYGGSLKAEHGTGRNMAPFVELEWGQDAYRLMWQLKRLLDPRGILNPGVVLSDDPQRHLKNLKPLPAADEIVDKCIECGFCEPVCPSRGLTLSPRQRIVLWRDIQAKQRAGVDTTALERDYQYQGIDTCAATGLCAQRCPVNINTGELIRKLRGAEARHAGTATWLARNFSTAMKGTKFMLYAANGARMLLGAPRLARLSASLSHASKGRVPQWTPAMPQPVRLAAAPRTLDDSRPRVVYLAACVSRAMGPAVGGRGTRAAAGQDPPSAGEGRLPGGLPGQRRQPLLRPAVRLQGLPAAGRRQARRAARRPAPGQPRRPRPDLLRHQPLHPAPGAGPGRSAAADLRPGEVHPHPPGRAPGVPAAGQAGGRARHLQHPAPGRKPGADRPGRALHPRGGDPGGHPLLRLRRRQGLHHARTQRPLAAHAQGCRAVLRGRRLHQPHLRDRLVRPRRHRLSRGGLPGGPGDAGAPSLTLVGREHGWLLPAPGQRGSGLCPRSTPAHGVIPLLTPC